ncbi:MAG: hypothetical protein QXO94_00045 [Candidatus Bathyarchaeia archaeon]
MPIMGRRIAIEWKDSKPIGRIEVVNGRLEEALIKKGKGEVVGEEFAFTSHGSCRLELTVGESGCSLGSEATLVTVRTAINPFCFFLRDVSKEYPIILPEYGIVVTEADDERSYEQIAEEICSLGLQTKLQRIESEPEESYASAAANTRELHCPTWLGLSRDIRIFEFSFRSGQEVWDWIQPRFHGYPVPLPEADNNPVRYNFFIGRGIGCAERMFRRLEEGVLPILHGVLVDDDVIYNSTVFVTLESTKLTTKSLRGTHFLVADGYGYGHIFTKEQEREFQSLLPEEMNREEETVLCFRTEAVNAAHVPRYAWFKNVFPSSKKALRWSYDGKNGFGVFESGQVFCISKLNGKPMPQEEIAILLKPGETASFEFFLPHRPISRERAKQLSGRDFTVLHAECREFWKEKLESAAKVKLPEKRIEEMIQAGLLHLDLVAYGLEPFGTVATTIGIYCPIGSESSPIIQFMDSMGWHSLARRSLTYFLDKQHEDGFIQNFDGYMLETGAALWSMGEHYRYTHDDDWVQQIKPKLLKACEYLLEWRNRNKREELRGKGYGMIEGKVADPQDPYHQFMLNGYAYLGLSRAAEMLSKVDPAQSERLAREAEYWKKDIREALFKAVANSPVVPLSDGTWCPTAPPWAEAHGPVSLYAEKGRWFTHLTFLARDSLLGPLHLIFHEVVDPNEQIADFLVSYYTDLMHIRNVAFSQPYYSCHPQVHLRRGEIKPFLKAYYNGFASLADRETYTFWEHYPGVGSPHKTHEEGWFLMQTRWMLWMEQGQTLKLLLGIPRSWMENGTSIELNRVASYFGEVSLKVESKLEQRRIEAKVECLSDRKPKCLELRLPHPQGRKAIKVKGGVYDANTETVRIEPFHGYAEVLLEF